MTLGTDLTGKVAVVTGVGGILCDMFIRTLARAGATVALLDINLEVAEEITRDVRKARETVAACGVDVMDKDMLESAHIGMLAQLGPYDILISGTGDNQARTNTSKEYFEMGDIKTDMATSFDIEYKGMQGVLDLNFLGGFLICRILAKDMVGREGYNVTSISSASAVRLLIRIPVCSGAMATFNNFTQWLAMHFAKAGARVNAIAPGFFVTRQSKGLFYEEDGRPAAGTARVPATIPMGRFGRSKELNGTLMFLFNSGAAGFITGIILPVDDGFSTYSGV